MDTRNAFSRSTGLVIRWNKENVTCAIKMLYGDRSRTYVNSRKSIDAFWDCTRAGAATCRRQTISKGDRTTEKCNGRQTDKGWVYISEHKIYKLRKRSRGSPNRGYITTRLELWREVDEETKWPYARKPLLYIGFSPRDDEPWEGPQLRLDQHGGFCGDLYGHPADVQLEPQTVRLWLWKLVNGEEAGGEIQNPWINRSCFFVLPLFEISQRKDIRSKFVRPIRILLGEENPTKALEMFRYY